MNGLLDFLQAASNTAASTVSGPVDLIGMGLRKIGVPVPQNALMSSEWMKQNGLMQDVPQSAASLAGETFGLLSPVVAAAKAPQIAGGLLKMGENAAAPRTLNPQAGVLNFDPRFDPRVKEADKLRRLAPVVEARQTQQVPTLSIADLEGQPFITSMSDRTAAGGLLTGVNDVKFNRPVDLRGGQDFMFDNPGQVWASAPGPVRQIMDLAKQAKQFTGKDPLYIPWRMAPSGGDFASMTGEAMLAHADAAMSKKVRSKADTAIRKIIHDWKGIGTEDGIRQYQSARATTRDRIRQVLDRDFRESGSLGIGEARLAVTDPKQYAGMDGQVMNVGRIFADEAVGISTHPSYPRFVPGEGVGRLQEELNIAQMLPTFTRDRGILNPLSPSQTDIRALQMKPYFGVIDEAMLRALGF